MSKPAYIMMDVVVYYKIISLILVFPPLFSGHDYSVR